MKQCIYFNMSLHFYPVADAYVYEPNKTIPCQLFSPGKRTSSGLEDHYMQGGYHSHYRSQTKEQGLFRLLINPANLFHTPSHFLSNVIFLARRALKAYPPPVLLIVLLQS